MRHQIRRRQDTRNYMVPELGMYGKAPSGDFGYNTSPITAIDIAPRRDMVYGPKPIGNQIIDLRPSPESPTLVPIKIVPLPAEPPKYTLPYQKPYDSGDVVIKPAPAVQDTLTKETVQTTATASTEKKSKAPLVIGALAALWFLKG